MPESTLRTFLSLRDSSERGSVGTKDAGRRTATTRWLRWGLMAGCAIAVGIAGHLGDPGRFTQTDPSLARLLRGMALIKGVIAIAGVAAVWWRVGRALPKAVAAGYLVGAWILVGSTMLIWQLSWIPLAAILFHAAALSMLVVTWRDR